MNDERALRVLLVDDNEMGSELLAEFLALSGLEARCERRRRAAAGRHVRPRSSAG
ncbi:hypothetical protein WJ971_11480 [Achromobacter xylosoxidans]